MRVVHSEYCSSVLIYILDQLYSGNVVNVIDLASMFSYDKSSIYAILRRIKYDLIRFNSPYKLIKKSTSNYLLINN